jgi:hypothetical protein
MASGTEAPSLCRKYFLTASTPKTPVSTSTVKRRLRDSALLGRVAKKKPHFRLTNKKNIKMGKRTQTLDRGTLLRRPASRSRLFTVDVETVVLRVLLNKAAG